MATKKHREEKRDDFGNLQTRARSGHREGDYATHLPTPTLRTRERSGKREGDYAPYLDTPLKNGQSFEKVTTRARSGKREGDYAPYLEAFPEKKAMQQRFKDCCNDLRAEEKLSKNPIEAPDSSENPPKFH